MRRRAGCDVSGQSIRQISAALFVVTAVLFAVGVAAEGEEGAEGETTKQAEATKAEEGETGEEVPDEGEEQTAGDEGAGGEEAEEGHDESGEETVFGVDVESPATVTAAVLASLALAVGLWLSTRRWIVLAAVAAGVVFAVFDAGEVVRQLDESRSGGAALAGVVAAGHLAAAGAAWLSTRSATN